jgi:hypothetical protein
VLEVAGEEIVIDPVSALAGITSAISLVKKAAKVANDLGSIAPMVAKLFDATSVARKSMLEAKRSKKGSNMGIALQIEVALDEAKRFEEELKMIFQASGRADVWNKIKARQAEMDRDDAKEISALKAEEKKAKQKAEEMTEIAFAIGFIFFVVFFAIFGVSELIDFCQKTGRCG